MSTRSVLIARATKARNDRVELSAQWMSSSSSRIVVSRPRRSSRVSSASNNRRWAAPSSARALPFAFAGPASSGSSVASSARAASESSSSVGSRSRLSGLRAATSGAYGSSPSPSSTHSPHSVRASSSRARWASSLASRVLPTPDQPAGNAIEGCPSPAAPSAPSSSASSLARPIRRVLETRAATTLHYRAAVGRTGAVSRTLAAPPSPRAPPRLPRNGSEQRGRLGRRQTEVPPRVRGGAPATWCALQEPALEEVRLVDVLDRVRLLLHGDRECGEADRAAAELAADRAEDLAVQAVQALVVDFQEVQRQAGGVDVDHAAAADLRVVADALEQPVRDARRAAGALGDRAGACGVDLDLQHARRALDDPGELGGA